MDQLLKNQIKEAIANKISKLLIVHFSNLKEANETLEDYQKVVREGKFKRGRTDEDIVLYQQDFAANKDDEIFFDKIINEEGEIYTTGGEPTIWETIGAAQTAIDNWTLNTTVQYGWTVGDDNNITIPIESTTSGYEWNLLDNINQFLTFIPDSTTIDTEKAKEILDTNIYELISQTDTRQEQINKFFGLYSDLKGGYPNFTDEDGDGVKEELTGEANQTDLETRISYFSDDEAFITRLQGQENDDNINRSLEWLRDDLSLFLEDVDKVIKPEDERPEYENQSEGYLKIRHLNQGIIIRKQEGDDVGISEEVGAGGLVANHPWTEKHDDDGTSIPATGPSYLIEGFTITMWVKFLDNVNSGTLFNYGNPLRSEDPVGFRLETFVLDKDEFIQSDVAIPPTITWEDLVIPGNFPNNTYIPFQNNKNKERFVRLVVYDDFAERLYDSHLFGIGGSRLNYVPQFGLGHVVPESVLEYEKGYEGDLLTHTNIPIDFNEWYFIVATYNPIIDDTGSGENDPDYWRGNMIGESYTHHSGIGAKCKVELISRSDLIRARGFKA